MADLGNFLGRLIYGVGVDASGVDPGLTDLDTKVEAAMKRLDAKDATVTIKADLDTLTRQIKEATAKVQNLEDDEATIKLRIGDFAFNQQLKKVKAKIEWLKMQRANVAVRLDEKGQFSRDARRVAADTQKVEGLFGDLARKITSARVNIGPFTLTLKALVPVMGTLAPLLANLAGGIVAVSGSLASAAAGGLAIGAAGFAGLALSAAGASFAIKPLITDFKTASTAAAALKTAQLKYGKASDQAATAQKAFNHAVGGMPPQASAAAKAWADLKAEFASRTSGIRGDFFSVLRDGLTTAHHLLPTFARDSQTAFSTASQGVHDWLEGLRSSEAQHILDNIMGNFNRSLPSILHGLGQFGTAFGRIASVASKFLPDFTRGFDRVATDFADSTSNADDLQHTIGGLVDQTHSWFSLIGATGRLLTTVLVGGAKQGQGVVDDLTASLNRWNAELSTAHGQNSMADFFDQAAAGSEQFFSAMRRLLTLLFEISRATQPIAAGFLEVVTALGDLSSAMVQLRPLRALLAGIGAGIATFFIGGKIAAFLSILLKLPEAIRGVGAAAAVAEAEMNPFLGLLSVAVGAFVAFKVAAGDSASALDRANAAQRRAEAAARAATTAFQNERDALKEVRGAALDLSQAHLDVRQATLREEQTSRQAQTAIDKYGKSSNKAKEAIYAHRQAEIDLKRAKASVTEATHRETDAAQKSNREYGVGLAKLQTSINSLKDERTTLRDDITAHRDAVHWLREHAAGSDQLKQAVQGLRTDQAKLSTTNADLRDKQERLNATTGRGAKIVQAYGTQGIDPASRKMIAMKGSSGQLEGVLRTIGKTFFGVGKTSHGMGSSIADVTNKILQSFGAKPLKFNIGQVAGSLPFQKGGSVEDRKARGGFTVPGSGDGDRYRTALPYGSFVMNRRATQAYGLQGGGMAPVALESGERVFYPSAVKALGADRLSAMNGAVGRFARGGFAPGLEGVQPNAAALGSQFVDRFGGYISSGLRAGDAGSFHSQGLAFDWVGGDWDGASRYANQIGPSLLEGIHQAPPGQNVSWDTGAQVSPSFWGSATWAQHISHIHIAVADKVKALATQIKRIAVQGPAGPARNMLQGQADELRKVANQYIAQHMPTQGPESVGSYTKFTGKVGDLLTKGPATWFSGGDTAGGGNTANPGLALNLDPGTDSGWDNATTDQWMAMSQAGHPARAVIKLAGHSAALPIIDKGPAGWTHNAIDVTEGGLGTLGFNTGNFPSGTVGSAYLARQTGGMVENPGHHGLPQHQGVRLPPKPKRKRATDFGTAPGSWYDWYHRAIDFYDSRGDTRQTAGKPAAAKHDWRDALRDVIAEEAQVQRIIKHEHKRIRKIDHTQMPKSLKKSEPSKHFHFRDKNKDEKHKEYAKAKKAKRQEWHQKRRAWEKQVRLWKKSVKSRKQNVRGLLPDLYQERRVDLPTRYNEIMAKITGQGVDAGLEQTASGQERYQALLAYGGNFTPLGMDVNTAIGRFGLEGAGSTGAPSGLPPDFPGAPGAGGDATGRKPPPAGRGIVTKPPAHGTGGRPAIHVKPITAPGHGKPIATRRPPPPGGGATGAGGGVQVDSRKTIHVTNNYKTQPKDPHTWSAGVRHELGALT